MRLGEVRNGWKLLYTAHVQVAPPQFNPGKLVGAFVKEQATGRILSREVFPKLDTSSIYVTPGGVAKRESGVEIKDRTL